MGKSKFRNGPITETVAGVSQNPGAVAEETEETAKVVDRQPAETITEADQQPETVAESKQPKKTAAELRAEAKDLRSKAEEVEKAATEAEKVEKAAAEAAKKASVVMGYEYFNPVTSKNEVSRDLVKARQIDPQYKAVYCMIGPDGKIDHKLTHEELTKYVEV